MIFKVVRWIFWNSYYCIVPGRTFDAFMKKMWRCWWPWKKFKPNVWHNDDGRQWEVCFEDASCYTAGNQSLRVEIDYAQDDNRVVGFTIWDETLTSAQKQQTKLFP